MQPHKQLTATYTHTPTAIHTHMQPCPTRHILKLTWTQPHHGLHTHAHLGTKALAGPAGLSSPTGEVPA